MAYTSSLFLRIFIAYESYENDTAFVACVVKDSNAGTIDIVTLFPWF